MTHSYQMVLEQKTSASALPGNRLFSDPSPSKQLRYAAIPVHRLCSSSPPLERTSSRLDTIYPNSKLTSESKLDILRSLKHIPGQFLKNPTWVGSTRNSWPGLTSIITASCTLPWAIRSPRNMSGFTGKRIWTKPPEAAQRWP
jgi:hypothetical protein